jgi:hypothetical protein
MSFTLPKQYDLEENFISIKKVSGNTILLKKYEKYTNTKQYVQNLIKKYTLFNDD